MNCPDKSINTKSEELTELHAELKNVVHLLEDESIGLNEVLILCNRLLITRQKIEKVVL